MDSILASPDFSSQSSAATRRLSTSSVGPIKLRDSCDACAASKVKCHKEKPVCSRCAKRKIPCKYVATKRAGRKHENRQSGASFGAISVNTQATTGNTLAESNWPITPSTASGRDYFTSANTIEASLGLHASSSGSEAFSSFLSPVTPSVFTTLPDLDTDFDRFFASNLPLLISETSTENTDSDLLGESRFFSGHNTPNSVSATGPVRIDDTLNILGDAVCELPSFFSHHSPSGDGRLSAADRPQSQGLSAPPLSCSCLIRALEYLRKLFPTPSESCRIAKRDDINSRNRDPTVQAVIAENESTISALNDMLDCPCSEDGYVLTIISLVIFRVMGWYAAAAGRAPINEDGEISVTDRSSRSSSVHQEQVLRRPEVVGNYHLGGKDSDRMAAQLVLSELHRVQRLINRLSEKLKGKEPSEGVETPNSLASGQIPRAFSSPALPFSPAMLDHLGTDLRRRLRTLSLDIVETLRSDL